ncbi:hypothetical protein V6N13_070850 [Hibiscus sabdariffa]|uniref:Uncharacterized protein n=1 Tax=Hibiscus sabdariffa TaxID=183260 RepID=A0ABR2TFM2_9ROSI
MVEIDPNPYLQGKTSSPRNQIPLGHRNKMTKPINQTLTKSPYLPPIPVDLLCLIPILFITKEEKHTELKT